LLPANSGLLPPAILKSVLRLFRYQDLSRVAFPFSRNPHGRDSRENARPKTAGFFFALILSLLAFFCERGIVSDMSESDRNALASKLAEIDQWIAEKEEVLFSLDDDAWTQAEKSLGKLLELRQDLEWELMAQ
jgi:hypothetical protein